MRARCHQCAELVESAIIATCKVHEAQLALDAAKEKKIETRKYVAAFYKARVEERKALTALAVHQRECGHLAESNTT